MSTLIDLVGKKFGKLTVLVRHGDIYPVRWVCECECGNIGSFDGHNLKRDNTTSCGCIFKSDLIKRNTKHSLKGHQLYNIWQNIKTRCYNKNTESYKKYGAKGVRMCDEWLNSFPAFYDWCMTNGWQKGLHIDKDIKAYNNGCIPNLYSPERCSIVTFTENMRHTSKVKIDHNKADMIRNSLDNSKNLSIEYGVCTSTIYNIRKYKSWV